MARKPDHETIVAERVLLEAEQCALPVDPFAIAKAADIEVVPKDTAGGVSGMLVRCGNDFSIAYSTHLQNEGFERFSVGHELGHYYLPGHVNRVLAEGDVHVSRAGFASREPHEVEADRFAAALLMPYELFVAAAATAGDGLDAIERLAALCKTSMSATGIRYVQCADAPLAIVVSHAERVEFCSMSDSFAALADLTRLRRGDRVPRGSAAFTLLGDPGRVLHRDREEASPHLHDWFATGPDLGLVEQAVGLGNYGRVLSVLTIQDGTSRRR